jgi:hemerythrin
MAFLKWNKSLSVKVKEIDEQHKKLVGVINKAHTLAKKKNPDKEIMKAMLIDLLEYARIHFSTEEKYFDDFNYSGSEEHKNEHAQLLLKAIDFANKIDKGENVAKQFLDFLKYWLEKHLVEMDQKYVKCFKDHGLE